MSGDRHPHARPGVPKLLTEAEIETVILHTARARALAGGPGVTEAELVAAVQHVEGLLLSGVLGRLAANGDIAFDPRPGDPADWPMYAMPADRPGTRQEVNDG